MFSLSGKLVFPWTCGPCLITVASVTDRSLSSDAPSQPVSESTRLAEDLGISRSSDDVIEPVTKRRRTAFESAPDFEDVLLRLGTATSDITKLRETAVGENGYDLPPLTEGCPPTSYSEAQIDQRALDIMRACGMKASFVPISVSADGSCLFNSLAYLLSGSETMSMELRTRSALELLTHYDHYKNLPTASDIEQVCPQLDDACLDCVSPCGFSSAYTIQAVANVLNKPINVLYPPMNGVQACVYRILNTTYQPTHTVCTLTTSEPLNVMWSRVGGPPSRTWTPNHFVPLLQCTKPDVHQLPVGGDCEHDDHPSLQGDTDVTKGFGHSSRDSTPVPTLKLMSNEQLLNLVSSSSADDILPKIPGGNKSNVRFVVDNSNNVKRKENNKRMQHVDDCGAWDVKGCSAVKTTYLMCPGGGLRTIKAMNDAYCLPKKVKQRQTWIPMDPQPKDEHILVMHRYYQSLAADNSFKRRTTWFSFLVDNDTPKVAVVEYTGQCPDVPAIHGNCKDSLAKAPYIRPNPELLQKIKDQVQNDCPKKIYNKMRDEANGDIAMEPRNIKQISDIKANARKQKTKQYKCTIADEVLQVLGMLRSEDPYVREVIQTRDNPPNVILYTDEQMEDLKSFLGAKSDHVIGMDRTYNLGACFVTTIVYKNLRVLRTTTREHPILLGPIFLHWDATFDTYHIFLSHLRRKLGPSLTAAEINIGSDDEAALVKAIKDVFPNATRYLCTKHLRDNVARYLQDTVGATTSDRNHIVTDIFGKDGLVHMDDTFTFEQKAKDLVNTHQETYPKFVTYFGRVKYLLLDNVTRPHNKNKHHKIWTNNNSESMNNQLKLAINWKAKKLPDLIDAIQSEVKMQMLDLRRCLIGSGNYGLCPRYKQFYITPNTWSSMTEKEKTELFKNFLASKTNIPDIQATNAQFSIPKVPSIARKPNQRKRPRAERAQPRHL